jgi:AraC-like DNA-binding protein
MDLVADLVAAMRLSGGVVIDAEFRAPWCVRSHLGPDQCAPFFPVPKHVIPYHFVRSGSMWARVEDGPGEQLGPGEIVLFPRNDPHFLYSSEPAEPLDAHLLVQPGTDGQLARISWGGGGDRCAIFCGYLGSDRPDGCLLHSLPPMLKVAVGSGVWGDWMESSLKLAATEITAGSSAVAQIAELLFGEAIRRYLESVPANERGWLAAIQDPAVSRALSVIHTRDCEPLDMTSLAREAGLSRSALNARFSALIGEPPIRYWTRRRLQLAASLLREEKVSASEAGFRVGFSSEAAFSRAFKREYGAPPSTWRRAN